VSSIEELISITVVWTFCCLYVLRSCRMSEDGSVGLPIAYLMIMSFLSCGALVYLNPNYSHFSNDYLTSLDFTEDMVIDGFLACLLSVIGLTVGCSLLTRRWALDRASSLADYTVLGPPTRLIVALFWTGGVAFVLTAILAVQPSIQSIIAAARNGLLVAVTLGFVKADRQKDRSLKLRYLVAASAIPTIYLGFFGFLSYGFIAVAIMVGFNLTKPIARPKNWLVTSILTLVIVYLMLSVFVTYMEVRDDMRQVLWNNETTLEDRFALVSHEASLVGLFNPFDVQQLNWVNTRLNQSIFIGKAISWLNSFPVFYRNGETVFDALFAWVPRLFWPDKPEAGGNSFASFYTNTRFQEDTAIGVGPVFEFYVNYGYSAVFFGSLAFGALIRLIDRQCARALRRGDWYSFCRLYFVGLPMIDPTGMLFFIVGSMAAAWVLASSLSFILRIYFEGNRRGKRQVAL
jgi:hypothetical protein